LDANARPSADAVKTIKHFNHAVEEIYMKKRSLPMLAFVLGVIAITANIAPAQAQATRTWVSGVGDDANPCSRTAPCKTFAGAISKTAPAGEINVLDPGGFGAVTVTKAITIRSDHIEAGVLVSGGPGITVNAAATDVVILEGLDFQGLGTGSNGVSIVSSSSVIVRRSTIHGFAGNGVNLTGAVGAKVLVQDCVISDNGGGVNVQGSGGVANTAVIDRSTIETNTNFAVQVAAGGAAFLSASNLIGSGPKIVLSGGTVTSYGDNVIRGTSAAITTTLPLQ
jgi:hypothetical protein